MSTNTYAVRDSMTMLRRNLKRAQRYPSMTISAVASPILMLLLFVYVFGGALGSGIDIPGVGSSSDRGDYINYVVPGILLMTMTSGAVSTAVSVCSDMTEGIINRFRTMDIAKSSVMFGHVMGNVIQTVVALVMVLGVALAVGFRPNASAVEWLAAFALLLAVAFALCWISAAMGLSAESVETASNAPLPLTFLPFLGSAVVTPDSMPTGLRWFAEYQPFTPMNETLRGLMMGTEIGNDAWFAIAWCVGLSVLGYFWAQSTFNKTAKS
ncbi:ABC transporter permease [Streptomyces sp. PmtG]